MRGVENWLVNAAGLVQGRMCAAAGRTDLFEGDSQPTSVPPQCASDHLQLGPKLISKNQKLASKIAG
jgi:hypothetical protein